MKSLFVLSLTFFTSNAWALDCEELGQALAAATNTCESRIPNDDLDGFSSCFNKEVKKQTSLSVDEVERQLLECGRR